MKPIMWLGMVLSVLLGACALQGAGTGAGAGLAPDSPAAVGSARDRVTESDETPETRRARVRLELASAYFSRGQLITALDEVKLAIASDPNLVSAFNLRGLVYGGLGDDRLAEESFRRALELDPRDADTLQNFGWHLCQRQRFDEAESLFNRALAAPQYQNSLRTLITLGACQARNQRYEAAEATLNRAYALDPSSPLAALNLAEVLYRSGQFDRARFFIRKVNANPEVSNAQTLWLGARIENKLNNTAGTQSLGRQLRERFPKSAEAIAFERGKFDE